MMAFFMFALIASSGLGMAFVWRNRDALFYRQQYETERERRDLAQRYEYLTKNANDIIIIMDRDLKIVEANDRAISTYGYPREEFFRLHLGDLYPKGHFAAGENPILEMKTQNGLTCESVHQRQDGTTFPVAVSSSEMEINGDKFYQLIIRDMSRNKEREKALLESEEQLRFLSSQLLMVQENERRRISKELHDGLGLSLTVLKFQLSSISAKVSEEKIGFRTDFQSLLNDLDGVIEDVRRLSWDLSPGALEELGFAAAINNLLEDFSEHYDTVWSRDEVDELNDSFSPLAQVNIYRIFQESLANIGRHAQASQITVSIIKHHASVSFAVEDNGQGFDMSEFFDRRGKKKGIGLAAMQERARLAGGDLKIWSNPGAGTKITFIIPMEEVKANVGTVSHPAG
jgi:PAS domain S-box-containing protein